MDQLARYTAFIADGGLDAEPAKLAHPDPGQDPRDGRQSHLQALGDLSARHPQAPEGCDDLDALLRCASRRAFWCRGAIQQALLALKTEPREPLEGRAVADSCGLGRLRQRPTLGQYSINQQLAPLDAEPRVSVQLHPVFSLVLGVKTPPASKETRMNNVLRIYN